MSVQTGVSRYQRLHDKEEDVKEREEKTNRAAGAKGDREEWSLHAPDREKNGWRVAVMVFLFFLFSFCQAAVPGTRPKPSTAANEHLESGGR